MAENLRNLNARIPAEMHKRLKMLAVAEEKTVQDLVTEAIARFLEAKEAGKQ